MRSSPVIRACFMLCCALLLATRAAGAHLHYCLDGSEPPVSVHYLDPHHFDHVHHELRGEVLTHFHDAEPVHSDVTVSVAAAVPLPKLDGPAGWHDLPSLAIGTLLPAGQLGEGSVVLATPWHSPPVIRRSSIPPPVRGPPA
jgi:hypothetical protein